MINTKYANTEKNAIYHINLQYSCQQNLQNIAKKLSEKKKSKTTTPEYNFGFE